MISYVRRWRAIVEQRYRHSSDDEDREAVQD